MRYRFTRALGRLVDTKGVTPLAIKVPEITLLFWAIKICSTAMGEALADFLDGPSNLIAAGAGSVLALVAFVVALRWQFRTTRYTTGVYWFAIAMVATFGTMAADAPHQFFGAPYWLVTIFYAIVLGLVFWRWWANERTLSIHSIDTRRREHFYWSTVLATFALGTATGDWTATSLHLGFFSSAMLFCGAITLPAIAYRLGASPITTFWCAYVLTRPLGASFADWFDYPRNAGGLGVYRFIVWGSLAIVMTGLVTVLARRERDPDSPAAVHPHAEAAHQASRLGVHGTDELAAEPG
ncbi:MAG TPA: hypothetical protein VHB69_07660 [Mycobacteriales bacterium]|nr:hypothetical protein [Mycobacteriales bacterium]